MNRLLEWGETEQDVKKDDLGRFSEDAGLDSSELDKRTLKAAIDLGVQLLSKKELKALLGLADKYLRLQTDSVRFDYQLPEEFLSNIRLVNDLLTKYPNGISSTTRQRLKSRGHV